MASEQVAPASVWAMPAVPSSSRWGCTSSSRWGCTPVRNGVTWPLVGHVPFTLSPS